MSDKLKGGALKRVMMFYAIAAMLGEKAMARAIERRSRWQGMPHRLRHEHRGAFGSSRAGLKLVKHMFRRPVNRGWVKLHPRPIHAGENRGHSAAYIGKWAGAKPGSVPLEA